MHILIAPNAFKHSLSATQVAEAIRQGFEESCLNCTCECFPIGDGGDGTGNLIIDKCGGTNVNVEVHDPLGRTITAAYGLIDGGRTAVIEMASASGIRLLATDELNPLLASSFGTGELIKHSLSNNIDRLIISMGGSATVDVASGMLSALGVKFLDANKNEISSHPKSLIELADIDISEIDHRIHNCEIVVLCDVENVLSGPDGAARVFGPQKGASPEEIMYLETFIERFREITLKQTGKDMNSVPGGGTAGGAAAALYAFLNAKLVNGIDHFLNLTGFKSLLRKADLVITGEGSIDEQTLLGKGPFGVASWAQSLGIPVIGIAGKVPLHENPQLSKYFEVLMAIGNEPSDITHSLVNTKVNLIRLAKQIGNTLAIQGKT